jgi:predicted phosphoribosyltransferase
MYAAEKGRSFKNRKDAGTQLGNYLKPKYGNQDPLIIGIPRGGIEVRYYVAAILEAEFGLIVSRKLSFRTNQDWALVQLVRNPKCMFRQWAGRCWKPK